MTATVFYDNVNQIATVAAAFTSSGSPADPTVVSCVVTDPSGTSTTYTVTAGQIVRAGTGSYTLPVVCSPAITGIDGLWSAVWIGTGAVSDIQPVTWRVLPSSLGTWYIGPEEMRDRLSIPDNTDDSVLSTAIAAASGWVTEYCARHFYRVTETRTFVPYDIYRLDIDDLVSVTSFNVDYDGDGTYEQSWVQGTDYQLFYGRNRFNLGSVGVLRPYEKVRVINSGRTFPFTWPFSPINRVQVTGTWGWPAVPPMVAEATRILAADEFRMKDAPFGILGMSDIGMVRIQSNPWLVENLERYVKGGRKVGV